jgi:hypothetical protein
MRRDGGTPMSSMTDPNQPTAMLSSKSKGGDKISAKRLKMAHCAPITIPKDINRVIKFRCLNNAIASCFEKALEEDSSSSLLILS